MIKPLYVRADENGIIVTYGDDQLPDSVEVVRPDDWDTNGRLKYKLSGTFLVVRDDWSTPVEPEVPTEPEAPAEPE